MLKSYLLTRHYVLPSTYLVLEVHVCVFHTEPSCCFPIIVGITLMTLKPMIFPYFSSIL